MLAADGWQVQVTDPDTNDYDTTACSTGYTAQTCARDVQLQRRREPRDGVGHGQGHVQRLRSDHQERRRHRPAARRSTSPTTAISNPRNLRVLIGGTGVAAGMKMCDPSYASTDPVGCPTT